MSDKEITAGIINGDIEAYRKLFLKYYPTLLCFIRGFLKNIVSAEDVAQNIFMKVWMNRSALDERKSIKNYLFVMARNEVFNALKSAYRMSVELREEIGEDMAEVEESTDNDMNCSELDLNFRKEISRMPQKRREVFIMSRYCNLSNQEIADRLRISVRTVEKHIEVALKDLRKSLN